jgi:hypothetical protein
MFRSGPFALRSVLLGSALLLSFATESYGGCNGCPQQTPASPPSPPPSPPTIDIIFNADNIISFFGDPIWNDIVANGAGLSGFESWNQHIQDPIALISKIMQQAKAALKVPPPDLQAKFQAEYIQNIVKALKIVLSGGSPPVDYSYTGIGDVNNMIVYEGGNTEKIPLSQSDKLYVLVHDLALTVPQYYDYLKQLQQIKEDREDAEDSARADTNFAVADLTWDAVIPGTAALGYADRLLPSGYARRPKRSAIDEDIDFILRALRERPELLRPSPQLLRALPQILQARTKPWLVQRWGAWANSAGAYTTTSGNAATGSPGIAARSSASTVGLNYRITPDTVVGVGIGGQGSTWTQGLGGGHDNSLQLGAYASTRSGPYYLSGMFTFGNYQFATSRVAGADALTANYGAQSYNGRLEGGYTFAGPLGIGVIPYAAAQLQYLHMPGYSEADLGGAGLGVSYNAMNATDTRTELGARFAYRQLVGGVPVVFRARAAWAHDWISGSSATGNFQVLPDAGFVVPGIGPPRNSALVTIGSELRVTQAWSLSADFLGDFGNTAQTYGGTAKLRYAW